MHTPNVLLTSAYAWCLAITVVALASTPALAQAPTLSSIAPTTGLEQGGTLVTLTGTNLNQITTVTIGGLPLDNLTVVGASTLTGNVPSGTPGFVDVTASGAYGADTLASGFAYAPSLQIAGTALRFDGLNDLVTFGTVTALGACTFEAWVRPEVGSDTVGTIVGHTTGPNLWCTNGTALRSHGDTQLCYLVDLNTCGSGWEICKSGTVVGQWYHLAGTFDGSTMRLYVDGVLVTQFSGATHHASTWMTAGATVFANGPQAFFSGLLDEVRVWNKVRTVQEIRDGMHRLLSGTEPNLVGYWRFDEGAGQTCARSSTSGPTGVLGTTTAVQSSDPTWGASGAPVYEALPVVPEVYCTAKLNSLACTPAIGFIGTPSVSAASGFSINAAQVLNNKNGLLFYGYQPDVIPFESGTLCIAAPLMRTTLQNAGGNPPPSDCSGTYAFEFNAHMQTANDPGLTSGAFTFAQYWYRDPQSAGNLGLTDALRFEIGP